MNLRNVFVPARAELADRLEAIGERLSQSRKGRFSPLTMQAETAGALQDLIGLVALSWGLADDGDAELPSADDVPIASRRWFSVGVTYLDLTDGKAGTSLYVGPYLALSAMEAFGLACSAVLGGHPGALIVGASATQTDSDANG